MRTLFSNEATALLRLIRNDTSRMATSLDVLADQLADMAVQVASMEGRIARLEEWVLRQEEEAA